MQIVTRDSFLALAQTLTVSEKLIQAGIHPAINAIKTQGDIKLKDPLYEVSKQAKDEKEGKAFFTKELEDALLSNTGDLAVHSLKDLPTEMPNGLFLSSVILPEDKGDTIVTTQPLPEDFTEQKNLLEKYTLGTSSLRRIALLKFWFHNAKIIPVRGNLITRINKLIQKTDGLNALLLATSGLKRLLEFQKSWPQLKTYWQNKIDNSIIKKLDTDYNKLSEILSNKLYYYSISQENFQPAVGQGTLGTEMRENDKENISHLLKAIPEDAVHRKIIDTERHILHELGAGCHVPFGLNIQPASLNLQEKKIITGSAEKNIKALSADVFYAADFNPNSDEKVNAYKAVRYFPFNNNKEKIMALIEEIKGNTFPVVYTGKNSQDIENTLKGSTHDFFHVPLIDTMYIEAENLYEKNSYDVLVISSLASLKSKAIKEFRNIKTIVAVGEKTKVETEKVFTDAKVLVPETYNAISAAKLIEKLKIKNILWLGARAGITDGIDYLTSKNMNVDVLNLYENVEVNIDNSCSEWENKNISKEEFLAKKAFWIFCSPSAVSAYLKQNLHHKDHLIACLGTTTATAFWSKDIIPYVIASKSLLKTIAEEIMGKTKTSEWETKYWQF
ncbi:MAG: uroporphyrinogen-III synthase [Spirochaetia bacterium]|nr:uroporphyrinogen-III synthase [Spirochaetia bacterium]